MKNKQYRIAVCTTYAGDEGVSNRIIALSKACAKKGVRMVTLSSAGGFFVNNTNPVNEGDFHAFHSMDFSDFDAIICFSEIVKDQELLEFFAEQGKRYNIPVLMEERHVDGCIDVTMDYTTAFEELCRHVVEEHGCRKVFFMGGMADNNFSLDRELIYKKVLEDNGIEYSKKNVYYGQFWQIPTEEEMDRMLASGNIPEALICANDEMAIAACEKFQEAGYRVPEDVIVTGLDGIDRSEWNRPTITTCFVDRDKQAEEKISFIIDWIEGRTKSMNKILHYSFRKAESCGCGCYNNNISFENALDMYESNKFLLNYNLNIYELQEEFAKTNDQERLMGIVKRCFEFEGVIALTREYDQFLDPVGDEGELVGNDKPYRVFYSTMPGLRKNELVDFKAMYTLFDDEKDDTQTFIMPINFVGNTYGFFAIKTEDSRRFYNLGVLLSIALGNSLGVFYTRNSLIQMNHRLEEVNDTLTAIYTRDNLTGLYNRHGFYDASDDLISEAREFGESMYIISIDMDDLKVINDNYGHAEGDSALTAFAAAIKYSAHDEDVCSRFGGDEFVVAGVAKDAKRKSRSFINKMNKFLMKYNGTSDKPYKVIASMGVSVMKVNEDFSLDKIIRLADREMYENKKEHKKNREKIRTTPEDLLHELQSRINQ